MSVIIIVMLFWSVMASYWLGRSQSLNLDEKSFIKIVMSIIIVIIAWPILFFVDVTER